MNGSGRLDRENTVVLYAVQAVLGLISRNVIAIAVHVAIDRILIRFWVRELCQEAEEDASDVVFEMEALFAGENPLIQSEILEGPPPLDWPAWAGRMIYRAKDQTS